MRTPQRCHRWLTRRWLGLGLALLTLALLASCGVLPALTSRPKLARVGYLGAGDPTASAPFVTTFRQALHEQDWIEGQNLVLDFRWAEGHFERFPALAADLLQQQVDVVYTGTDAAARAVQEQTTTVPIVVFACGDPVREGLVESLAHPGGNVTGVTSNCINSDLRGKELELLKEMVPGATRVAVLYYPAHSDKQTELAAAETASRLLGMEMKALEVRAEADFEPAFLAASHNRADALFVFGEAFMLYHRGRLTALAAQYRLPAMYEGREYVDEGGLMSYGPPSQQMVRRAVVQVGKILRGAKPADLPVEQPMTFDFVLNLKTAQALGLTIPKEVLLQATDVIQ